MDGGALNPPPDSASDFPDNENPGNAVDGTNAKYLNFGEENSGFIVTPAVGASTVKSFQILTGNDAPNRDPTSWQLFGTNQPIVSQQNSFGTGEAWTLIGSGTVALPITPRNTLGPVVPVDNTANFTSYKMLFPTIRNAGGRPASCSSLARSGEAYGSERRSTSGR